LVPFDIMEIVLA